MPIALHPLEPFAQDLLVLLELLDALLSAVAALGGGQQLVEVLELLPAAVELVEELLELGDERVGLLDRKILLVHQGRAAGAKPARSRATYVAPAPWHSVHEGIAQFRLHEPRHGLIGHGDAQDRLVSRRDDGVEAMRS